MLRRDKIACHFSKTRKDLDRSREIRCGQTPHYSGRHFSFYTNYNDFSPNFCTELGFVNRIDIRQETAFAGYLWRPVKSKLIDLGPSVRETVDWNHAGVLQDWQASLGFQFELRKQTAIGISRGEAYELFANIGFRKHSTAVFVSTQPYKWIAFCAGTCRGPEKSTSQRRDFCRFLET
jgi:hypothetical protein